MHNEACSYLRLCCHLWNLPALCTMRRGLVCNASCQHSKSCFGYFGFDQCGTAANHSTCNLHKAQDEGCSMTHVGYSMFCHFRMGGRLDIISRIHWEKLLGSCWDNQPYAGQQEQGTTRLVEHCVEGLVLVFGTSQQETAACTSVERVALVRQTPSTQAETQDIAEHICYIARHAELVSRASGNFSVDVHHILVMTCHACFPS